MKLADLRNRLLMDRPQATITIRMPEDVIQDLKRLAPLLGFSGYQPLLKAYVGEGLRRDLERLERDSAIEPFVRSLRSQGVADAVIEEALVAVREVRGPESKTGRRSSIAVPRSKQRPEAQKRKAG